MPLLSDSRSACFEASVSGCLESSDKASLTRKSVATCSILEFINAAMVIRLLSLSLGYKATVVQGNRYGVVGTKCLEFRLRIAAGNDRHIILFKKLVPRF